MKHRSRHHNDCWDNLSAVCEIFVAFAIGIVVGAVCFGAAVSAVYGLIRLWLWLPA